MKIVENLQMGVAGLDEHPIFRSGDNRITF